MSLVICRKCSAIYLVNLVYQPQRVSERMTSAANLLVDTHRLHLNDEITDKVIVLRVNKIFMKIVRTKKAFSSVMYSNILSDKSTSL